MGSVTNLTVRGLTDYESQALHVNLDRLLARRRGNLKRSALYDGKNAMQRSSVVPEQYHRLGIALGWSAKAVDALTRRTQLERFTWADGALGDLGMDRLERSNALRSELSQALTDSALHGVSFLITTKGAAGEPGALVHARDATSATGTWNPRTRRLDDALSVTRWDETDGRRPVEFALYLNGLTVTASKVNGTWDVERTEHPWGVPVEPLVYKPRPSRRYGQSRLTRPIMGLHMQAVRELIRLEGHMDIYSYPEFWLLGGDMSSFKNADGSQKAVWQVMLGRIKGIEDNDQKPDHLARTDVKQFPAASPDPHGVALDLLSRAFAREASLPDSAVALKGTSNPTSADAYDASQYELIAEAEGAMSDWSTPLSRTVARALAIQNDRRDIPEGWLSITPGWLGAKFESRAARADAGAKQLGSVPWLAETEVGLELLGLEPEQVKRALGERTRANGRSTLMEALSATEGDPQVTDDAASANGTPQEAEDAIVLKNKFDALGTAIRAGVEPSAAAALLGLSGIAFTGAVPVSLRLPGEKAQRFEGSGGGSNA